MLEFSKNTNAKYKTSPILRAFFCRRTSIHVKDTVVVIQKGKKQTEINIEDIEILPKSKNRNIAYDTIIFKAKNEIEIREISYKRKTLDKNVIDLIVYKYMKIYEEKLRNIAPFQKEIYNIINTKYPTKDVVDSILSKTKKSLSMFNECWDQSVFQDDILMPYKYLENLYKNHKSIFDRIKTKYKIVEKLNVIIKPEAIAVKKQLNGIFPRDSLISKIVRNIRPVLNRFADETNNAISDFEADIDKELISEYKYLENMLNNQTFFDEIRSIYIKQKKKENKCFFDSLVPKLNNEQVNACITDNDNNLIIAGAGTGKTSTMIAKGAYLVRNKMCLPHEILMVVFNNNARRTLIDRNKKYEGCENVNIHTFHSLGRAISATTYGHENKELSEEMQLLSKNAIKKYVKQWMQQLMEDESYAKKIIDYILWEQCTSKTTFDFATSGEYYRYIDANKLYTVKKIEEKKDTEENENKEQIKETEKDDNITYKRERVRSKGEWIIANYLFVNNIKYYYGYQDQERTEIKGGEQENGLSKEHIPNIYLPDYKVYIEYLELDINGNPPPGINKKEYENYINERRTAFEAEGCDGKLIECYHYELQNNKLLENLEARLLDFNVVLDRLSDEVLLNKLTEYREYEKISEYLFSLISVVKGACETDEEIYTVANQSKYKSHVLKVLELMMPLKDKYEDFLKNYGIYLDSVEQSEDEELIDFCDMINIAIKSLRSGILDKNKYRYKYILVDEFQDISKTKSTLIELIRDRCSSSSLFCVGDDWQSIYRFAGSDIKYITAFDEIYGSKSEINLSQTFRFNNQISKFAEDFINIEKGNLKEKTLITNEVVNSPRVSLLRAHKDNILKSIRSVLDKILDEHEGSKPEVYILCRYNKKYHQTLHKDEKIQVIENGELVEKIVVANLGEKEIIEEYRDKLSIEFITMHRSKGLEADYVIIIGLDNEAFAPFPAEREDPISRKVYLPEKEKNKYAEERRLFYVAITRAKKKIYLIADFKRPSEFIREIFRNNLDKIMLNEFEHGDEQVEDYLDKTCPSCGSGYLKISNARWEKKYNEDKYYTKLICTNSGNYKFKLCDFECLIPNESSFNFWGERENGDKYVNKYLGVTIIKKTDNCFNWKCLNEDVEENSLEEAKEKSTKYALKMRNKDPVEFYLTIDAAIKGKYNKK